MDRFFSSRYWKKRLSGKCLPCLPLRVGFGRLRSGWQPDSKVNSGTGVSTGEYNSNCCKSTESMQYFCGESSRCTGGSSRCTGESSRCTGESSWYVGKSSGQTFIESRSDNGEERPVEESWFSWCGVDASSSPAGEVDTSTRDISGLVSLPGGFERVCQLFDKPIFRRRVFGAAERAHEFNAAAGFGRLSGPIRDCRASTANDDSRFGTGTDEKAGLMRLCCPSGEAFTAGTFAEELSERSTGTCERDLAPSVRPLFGEKSESRKVNIFSH